MQVFRKLLLVKFLCFDVPTASQSFKGASYKVTLHIKCSTEQWRVHQPPFLTSPPT